MIELPSFDTTFVSDVENHVASANVSYIDAIVHWCEQRKVEIEYVVPMIIKHPIMKLKIQGEGERLNFLPKTTRIPI